MPEIGAVGQSKLKGAGVLIVGVGGLGCPAALYLAAAGIGRLGLVDGDRVDVSNLHRQVLFGDGDVGRLKVEVAKERLAAINPHLRIEAIGERLDASNAARLIGEYDIVIDAADNFATRYLINDGCVMGGRALVQGSVHRFEGQVTVFHHDGGPCYRCLFPEAPPAETVPDCAAAGVLGILPGMIGMLQATEAIKLAAGIGRPLSGRLLLYDALAMTFRELPIARDEACAVCGGEPTITELKAESVACVSGAAKEAGTADETTIDGENLAARLAAGDAPGLLDVRQPYELEAGMLPGAVSIPLDELEMRLEELDRGREWVVYCAIGMRSERAAAFMRSRGFAQAKNLIGGTAAWMGPMER